MYEARHTYHGMQRTIAADPLEKIRELARKRGRDDLGQRNSPVVAEEATDRIRAGRARSEPASSVEVLELAQNPGRAERPCGSRDSGASGTRRC
jgi:hypothetical protein